MSAEEMVRAKIRQAIFLASPNGRPMYGLLTRVLEEELGAISFRVIPPTFTCGIEKEREV